MTMSGEGGRFRQALDGGRPAGFAKAHVADADTGDKYLAGGLALAPRDLACPGVGNDEPGVAIGPVLSIAFVAVARLG